MFVKYFSSNVLGGQIRNIVRKSGQKVSKEFGKEINQTVKTAAGLEKQNILHRLTIGPLVSILNLMVRMTPFLNGVVKKRILKSKIGLNALQGTYKKMESKFRVPFLEKLAKSGVKDEQIKSFSKLV